MKDTGFEYERNDLSIGGEIFLLDLNGKRAAQNIVAGMIITVLRRKQQLSSWQ